MRQLLFNPQQHPEITYDDIFLVPNNPIEEELQRLCNDTDVQLLKDVQQSNDYNAVRRVTLDLCEKYGIGKPFSRDDVDLTPNGGLANTSVIVSNMTNVTGKRQAEASARVGAIAAVPQDKSNEEIEGIISYLRSRHPVYETPVNIHPDAKVHEVRRLLSKRSHDTAVVTNGGEDLVGVLSKQDIPEGMNADASVSPFIRHDDIVTAKDGINASEAIALMDKHHIHYLPILSPDGRVVGVLPKIDAAMRLRYRPNVDSENGGLRAIFTVGALNKDPLERVRFLIDHGIRDILFDTANFDQGVQPYRNVERARNLAEQRNVRLNLIAGNVVTRKATRNILAAGAQFVKVGIGPGAMCTTRMETGVGRPQVTAILECSDEAHAHGGYVIADGGIQYPRDVAIAHAAGADYVMVGSLFAGTYESPGDLQEDENGFYKICSGMASQRASLFRTLGRLLRTDNDKFRDVVGHRSEGLSEARVYLKKGAESTALVHHKLLDGTASMAAYVNARSIREVPARTIMGLQTRSGFMEGTPKPTF